MSVTEQVKKIQANLVNHPDVKVVAAVKYFDVAKTREIVEAGIKDIGENRKDAFLEKYEALKDLDITWHYFGIIKIPPKLNPSFIDAIDYLHSLDSIDLANAINKTRRVSEPLKCFIYVNIASSPNKAGLEEAEVIRLVKSIAKYDKIEVVGLMTTGKNTFDEELIASYFDKMVELQKEVQALHIPNAPCTELSMGMSNDYQIAVEHGATFVRLGQIFSK